MNTEQTSLPGHGQDAGQVPQPNRPPKSLRSRFYLLLKILLSLAILYAVHDISVRWAQPELEAKKVRIRALRAEVKELGRRVESSRVRQKMAERQVEVLRQANNLLRQEESNRQAEMQRLQGEVDFYQRLAGTSGSQEGLAVYQLEMQATASPQVYRFVLTLTQNLRRSAIVSGTASLELEGTREDKVITLKWKDLSTGNTGRPEFRFKYFQQLDGYLTIPEDFQPERVRVSLNAKGSRQTPGREFSWTELMQPAIAAPLPSTPAEDAEALEHEVEAAESNP